MARKILLADDSVTAQNMGRKILADAGYDVVTVNNGSAALKRVPEIKPDLIVLDVYMPGYSGLEVCQRLKDAPETTHIPVLLTVGKLEPFKADEARRVHADAHIVKPFEASELLTAITRLEDCIVPQHAVRPGGHAGARTTEGNADPDTGWKSRLSFSAKKKKDEEEAAPEVVTAAANFRDFRNVKGKATPSESLTPQASPLPRQEPVSLPDIPRDITPDELDALTALASKLNQPIPPADDAPANPELEASSAQPQQVETPAPLVEPAMAEVAVPVFSVEAKSELEIPVECVELAVEHFPVAEPVVVENNLHGSEPAEIRHLEAQPPETPVAFAVNTALLPQEPAPVDRDDEPKFASFASAVEQAAQENIQIQTPILPEETPVAALAGSETAEATEPAPESELSKPIPYEISLRDVVPSDAELVEALRLLTPATGYTEAPTVPAHGTLAAAGQLLLEEAARHAAATPRWVAEPKALSPEEAAISLEAEMIRMLAAPSAAATGEVAPEQITGVSAIAAAVENRLAEAEATVAAKTLAEPGAAYSDEPGTEGNATEPSGVDAPKQVMAMAGNEVENLEPQMIEAQQTDFPSEVPAATFANQAQDVAEDAPKAMAAAAAESSPSMSATDASTIASIVDSVMADLRPKLVEEIAKKLARK